MNIPMERYTDVLEQLQKAETREEKERLRERFASGGYSAIYRLVDAIRERIRVFADGESDAVLALVDKARDIVPEPGKISPAWQDAWTKLERMVRFKQRALDAIPPAERDGEWQVLIDNPFENRETACYPGLTFAEAVFIYAKLRPDLVENEYIRLQKVVTHLTEFGADA
jgi:hypothetical protein